MLFYVFSLLDLDLFDYFITKTEKSCEWTSLSRRAILEVAFTIWRDVLRSQCRRNNLLRIVDHALILIWIVIDPLDGLVQNLVDEVLVIQVVELALVEDSCLPMERRWFAI